MLLPQNFLLVCIREGCLARRLWPFPAHILFFPGCSSLLSQCWRCLFNPSHNPRGSCWLRANLIKSVSSKRWGPPCRCTLQRGGCAEGAARGGWRGKLRCWGAAGAQEPLPFPGWQEQPHPESQHHSLVAGCSCSISVGSVSLKKWKVKNPLADSAINPGFSCSLLNLTLGRQKKRKKKKLPELGKYHFNNTVITNNSIILYRQFMLLIFFRLWTKEV